MKFTCEVNISGSKEAIAQAFRDTSNFSEWQSGFISHHLISGMPEEIGTKSRIHLEQDGRSIILVETILENDLPDQFMALYEHEHMVNTMTARFDQVEEGLVHCHWQVEYTKFIGWMPKLMALIMPGMFRKQTKKWLDDFKRYVERVG